LSDSVSIIYSLYQKTKASGIDNSFVSFVRSPWWNYHWSFQTNFWYDS